MTHKKKLIEVALPLEAINTASAREKSIRHGHPSTLHLWWARRPLAAARAVCAHEIGVTEFTHGIGAVVARAPRAAVDCNRGEDEIDPAELAD